MESFVYIEYNKSRRHLSISLIFVRLQLDNDTTIRVTVMQHWRRMVYSKIKEIKVGMVTLLQQT